MDYENFKEQFVEDVKEKLYEQGTEVDITVNTVNKLNESYEAMTVKPEGSNIGVNIGIDKFYGATQDGISYDDVVDKAVNAISDGFLNQPQIDVASLTDYDQMKDKLVMEVVSAETNKEMLENVPHQNMEDMAVVYRFVLNSDDEGRASILATNQMIENMGVTPEQLHADALENAPRIKPAEIKGMGEVLAEMMGVEQAEMMGLYPVRPEDEQIFVASVPDKVHGAGVLAYQDFMDQAAERAGGDFYLLEDVEDLWSINWDYHMPFDGFARFLEEQNISDYKLIIDEEGSAQNTLNAAFDIGHVDVEEQNSNICFGIRMADMLAGIIAKFMKALSVALASDYSELKKTILDKKWFGFYNSILEIQVTGLKLLAKE